MTPRNQHAAPISLFLTLCLILPLAGCTGYRLGSNLPPGIRTVYIPVFMNDTGEPGLETLTTSSAIAEVQKDGSLRVVPREVANCVLEVTLRTYKMSPLRYRKDDTTTAQEYRLDLTADYVLKKLPTNEILSKGKGITGFTDITSLVDLPSARKAALPAAATDLAHRIIREITEYW